MKAMVTLFAALTSTATPFADQPPRLAILPKPDSVRLTLSSPGIAPVAGTRYRLEVQSSSDVYVNVAERYRARINHYEFQVPGPVVTRLSDSEWNVRPRPPSLAWTAEYLVPQN